MRTAPAVLLSLLSVCVAATLMTACEKDDDETSSDDTEPADESAPTTKAWTPYVGEWYGSGLREVWVTVSESDGTVTVRDNVNPESQSQPWSNSLHFEFSGGPTCSLDFHSPSSATVNYTHNSYAMTKTS